MTDDELKAIEARANAATEWSPDDCEVCTDGYDGHKYACQGATLGQTLIQLADTYEGYDADWIFLAHARTDVPALVAAVRERDAEIARLRALLAPAAIVSRPPCRTCLRAWDVCVCAKGEP